jgi:hypothetical protein
LSISYEGEKYTSDSIKFLYYDTPEIYGISPVCGPVTGYTQITVFGKNFLDMGFGKAKCIFNDTYYTNATIMENDIIKCDSPILPPGEGYELGHGNAPWYHFNGTAPWYSVAVTLNGKEIARNNTRFSYYIDPQINSVSPNLGLMRGGTVSKIIGSGFLHGVCNLTVRYGAIHVKPTSSVSDTEIEVSSPKAEVPDAIVVSVSLNGQQFVGDITLHHRDPENTFTYF